jgi:integrase
LVLLLVITGLRIGESVALRWRHVDLEGALLRVEETVYEGHFDEPRSRQYSSDPTVATYACNPSGQACEGPN